MPEIDDEMSEGPAEDMEEKNNPEAAPNGPEEAEAGDLPGPGAPKDSVPDAVKPEEPVVICEICGPVKGPDAKVYQCQLCMRNFCIKHIDPFFHDDPATRQG
jgi:hypothetical protein